MKVIKFRGWHAGMKRMIPCEEMVIDQMALLPDGRFANIHGSNTRLSTIYPADKFVPLQFTGLADKNGTEIYEGDILCCFSSDGKDAVNLALIVKLPEFFREIWSDKETTKQVIGNIYENPELTNA